MTVENTSSTGKRRGELKRVLEKVFHERCGLPVEITFRVCRLYAPRNAPGDGDGRSRRIPPAEELRGMGSAAHSGQSAQEPEKPLCFPGNKTAVAQLCLAAAEMALTAAVFPEGVLSAEGLPAGPGERLAAYSGKASGGGGVSRGSGKRRRPAKREKGTKEKRLESWRCQEKIRQPDVLYGRDFEDDLNELEND